MKNLWAPWRMDYVLSKKGTDCVFCPGDDRGSDKDRNILYVGSMSLVIMNKFPYNNGHLLVAPIRHVSDLGGLSNEENLDLILMVRSSIEIIKKTMKPEGFNVGLNLGKVAGAGVEAHLHYHIVPRWIGDTNFMAVTEEVRVIPEHLKNTYDKLRPHFEQLQSGIRGNPAT
jgi:ATP adenylyltransferase